MDKVAIELTKEEADLLPLLYKVPMKNVTLENAPELIKYRITVDGLMKKVQAAFEKAGEGKE